MDLLRPREEARVSVFNKGLRAAAFVVERFTGSGDAHPMGRDTSHLGVSAYFDRTVSVEPLPIPATSGRSPLSQ